MNVRTREESWRMMRSEAPLSMEEAGGGAEEVGAVPSWADKASVASIPSFFTVMVETSPKNGVSSSWAR